MNLSYKRYFRKLYYNYEIGIKDNLHDLHVRLEGGSYKPQHPTKIYLPKPSGLQRPITLLCIEDQIVLQAIANIFARKVLQRRQKLEYKFIFSNITQSETKSIFFLQNWRFSYSQFQAKITDDFNRGYEKYRGQAYTFDTCIGRQRDRQRGQVFTFDHSNSSTTGLSSSNGIRVCRQSLSDGTRTASLYHILFCSV